MWRRKTRFVAIWAFCVGYSATSWSICPGALDREITFPPCILLADHESDSSVLPRLPAIEIEPLLPRPELAALLVRFFARSVVLQEVALVIQFLDKRLASLVVGVHQVSVIGLGQFFHEMA